MRRRPAIRTAECAGLRCKSGVRRQASSGGAPRRSVRFLLLRFRQYGRIPEKINSPLSVRDGEMVKVALPGIPLWSNQEIVLYHGTLDVHVPSILQRVDPTVCRFLTDFGRGFYTTTNLLQAERWARGLALQTVGAAAAVLSFSVDRDALAQLECLTFARGSANAIDFWSFVQYCRTVPADHNRPRTGWYDIVVGPVTGSWQKQTVIPDGDQFSFHTDLAASLLDNSHKARVV